MNYITVTLPSFPCRGSLVEVGLPQKVRVVHTTPRNMQTKAMVVEWTIQGKVYQRTYLFKIKR